MTDTPHPADYPLEQYATALEAMANEPVRPYVACTGPQYELPAAYAEYLIHDRAYKLALMSAAKMLRGTPMSLYMVYPDHFPDPREDNDDDEEGS